MIAGLIAVFAFAGNAQSLRQGDVSITNVSIAKANSGYLIEAGVTNQGTSQAVFNLNYSFSCITSGVGGQLANGELLNAASSKVEKGDPQNLCNAQQARLDVSFVLTYWTASNAGQKFTQNMTATVAVPGKSNSGIGMSPLEVGFNRQGSDLTKNGFAVASANECSDTCLQNGACRAMTFVRAQNGGICWLKSSVPAQSANGAMVSAYKTYGK